jgi:hypothetical protein
MKCTDNDVCLALSISIKVFKPTCIWKAVVIEHQILHKLCIQAHFSLLACFQMHHEPKRITSFTHQQSPYHLHRSLCLEFIACLRCFGNVALLRHFGNVACLRCFVDVARTSDVGIQFQSFLYKKHKKISIELFKKYLLV